MRMTRPENKSPRKETNETHQAAKEIRGKRESTGRDSGFGLARPVPDSAALRVSGALQLDLHTDSGHVQQPEYVGPSM
jgi:hypothetical protein